MKTCFLDEKSQEILGEENYPIEEADRIVAMNPKTIDKDMDKVFEYLCTNTDNRIEFIETPYLNTKQIRQYTDEIEKNPEKNFYPLITDILLDAYTLAKEGKSVVRSHITKKAYSNGKKMGNRPGQKVITNKSKTIKPLILEKSIYFNGNTKTYKLAEELGIAPLTLKKYIKELQEEQKGE